MAVISRIPEMLADLQKARRWSQAAMAKQIGVTQSTISRWIRGAEIPRESHFAALVKAGIDEARLRTELDELVGKRRQTLLDDRTYLDEQQEFLADLRAQLHAEHVPIEALRVCFLGPTALPVVELDAVRKTWIANLSSGISYVLLWFLDLVDVEEFRSLPKRLSAIGREVMTATGSKGTPGQIFHYAISSPDLSKKDVLREYERCCITGAALNTFFPPEQSDQMTELYPELLRYHMPFGSLVVYYHGASGPAELASFSLRDVRLHRREKPHRLFAFLDDRDSAQLTACLWRFFKIVGDPKRSVTKPRRK